MNPELPLKQILEAALLATDTPLSIERLQYLFAADGDSTTDVPDLHKLRVTLTELAQDYVGHGVELQEVATGWRIQIRQDYAPWVARLFAERATRYSKALLETLAIIAYRQPVTRGDIEAIRGIAVNSQIIRTLQERSWIRVIGHREAPGHPELLATTRQFLDYFGLHTLSELPNIQALTDFEQQVAKLLDTGVLAGTQAMLPINATNAAELL